MEPSFGRAECCGNFAICYSDELQASLAPPVANYLFINYEYPPIGGGSATACQQIAQVLCKRGHEVTVLTSGIGSLHGTIVEDGVTIIRLRTLRKQVHQSGVLEMLSYLLAACWKVSSISKAHRFDSTLAFFSVPGGIVARWLHLRTKVPYVVSLRGGDVPGTEPHLAMFYRVLQPLRRNIFKNARSICAPSQGLKELSERTDPYSVEVIPNGVDLELFRPDPAVRPKTLTLLSVGRLHAQKNVAYLLKIVAAIRDRLKTPVTATIVGDGPERPNLEQLAADLGITSSVRFAGWLDRAAVRTAYQSATFLIHASTYEGMSNVILEALASGLPVAASRIPGNTELIEPGVNGFLLDPEADPVKTAELICPVFSNQAAWERLSQGARSTIESRFSWNHAADLYEQLLKTTADEPDQPRMDTN
jgi:glycosyltransferase involved in cell wall biosynthesis